ncbi:MAG TPA: beta-propeller domain-containing protein [Nitrosopumilaceae archaeon]|nr:beta-propeller domain-containing protein [Nitrosopumilaceae archaeon]
MNNKVYIIIASIAAVVVGIAALAVVSNQPPTEVFPVTEPNIQKNVTIQTPIQNLKKFNSTDDLKNFLINSMVQVSTHYSGPMYRDQFVGGEGVKEAPVASPVPQTPTTGAPSTGGGIKYSTTNVQVAGIDEPDFIKNDNKYAYVLSQDKLSIIDAYPGETAKIISKVGLDVKGNYLQNMFLNKDRLVIFYNDNTEHFTIQQYDYIPSSTYTPVTHAVIIDVSDKENPKVLKNYEMTGYYTGARMIGDYVYLISNSYVDYIHPIPPIFREMSGATIMSDVYYFDNPEQNYNFNTITSFNIFSDEVNSKTFMMGPTGTIYVSNDAIYLTYQKYQPYYYDQGYNKDRFFKTILPLLPEDVQVQIKSIDSGSSNESLKWAQISDILQNTYNKMDENEKTKLFERIQNAISQYEIKLQQDYRKTVIQKFAIDKGVVSYVSKGEVSGYLLNQYSMDEFEKRFRVATTTEYYTSKGVTMANNVYILDESLNIVGSVEKVAPEESIFSARFMGEKLYLVTFQRIDPFFVIDLSTDTPKVLGALKIPGYSSYLHPYDDTHIIGVGKETKQNQYGGTQTIGVKVSLFDVSNVTSPVAVDTYLIGGEGTDSEILNDPKAFLFDKEKNILSIPVFQQYYGVPIPLEEPQSGSDSTSSQDSVVIPDKIIPPRPIPPNNWKGFYVFGVDPIKGFTLKGTIDHIITGYDYSYGSRTFYIDNSLYTVTSNLMKINDLDDLKNEVNQIKLEGSGQIIKYLN